LFTKIESTGIFLFDSKHDINFTPISCHDSAKIVIAEDAPLSLIFGVSSHKLGRFFGIFRFMELPSATVAKSILDGRSSESLLAKNRDYTHNQPEAALGEAPGS
jgi:hypothetical protein